MLILHRPPSYFPLLLYRCSRSFFFDVMHPFCNTSFFILQARHAAHHNGRRLLPGDAVIRQQQHAVRTALSGDDAMLHCPGEGLASIRLHNLTVCESFQTSGRFASIRGKIAPKQRHRLGSGEQGLSIRPTVP